MKKVRKPFLFILVISLIGGGIFCYAYFTKSYFFKEVKIEIKGPRTIKIGLFSDLHAISKDGKSLDNKYKSFIEELANYSNQSHLNFMVVNGDLIEGTKRPAETGMLELDLVRNEMEKVSMQKFWIIGNHDLRSVIRQQWKEALKIDYLDKSIEIDGYRIIFLDSNYGSEGKMNDSDGADTGFLLSEQQFFWLENELKNSDGIKIVFMHHPPITGDDVKPGYSPRGIKKIQEIFAKYGVVAVFSGHTERLSHQNISGVDYFVFPGPAKFDFYPGAYETIRMIGNKAIVTFFVKNEKGEYVKQKIE